MTRAPQLSGRRHIFVTPVAAVSLQRGRKSGGRGGGCPPLFEKGGHSPPLFFARDDNFLSTTMPLHTYVYRTNGNI